MHTTLSPEQMAQRLAGITATDIAAIVGVHPYRSAADVWMEKTGRAQAFQGNDRTKWGILLEPVIRKDFEERRNVRVEVPGTLERDWMRATPDGIVYEQGAVEADEGLEIKCHTIYLSHLYGAPGSDEVPAYELCQCTWNMAVSGLPRWSLVPFIDGQTRDYLISKDDELIGILKDRAHKFLVDNIRGDKMPEPDGSERYDEALASTYKKANADAALVHIDNDPMRRALVERLRVLKAEIAVLEKEETSVVQALKKEIGDNAGLEWREGKKALRVTWKQPKDSIETNYAGAFEQIRGDVALLYSAKRDDIKRAMTCLDKLAEQYFANTRANMQGKDIRDLLADIDAVLSKLATSDVLAQHKKTVPNSRRFTVPKAWNNETK